MLRSAAGVRHRLASMDRRRKRHPSLNNVVTDALAWHPSIEG
jgi:hypothetical protein